MNRIVGKPCFAVAAAIVVAVGSGTARAQCEARWLPQITTVNNPLSITRAIAVIDADRIVVGGHQFNVPGATVPTYIGRYDFTTGLWTGLGTNATWVIRSIVVTPEGRIIAAGQFSEEGSPSGFPIGWYNAEDDRWMRLGPTGSRQYWAESMVVLRDGRIVAAGGTNAPGGAESLMMYHPATDTWESIPLSLNAQAVGLLVLRNGDLVVGGSFTSIAGHPASRLALMDIETGSWTSLNADGPGIITSIAEYPNGDLLVGGSFTTIGGVPASCVARLDREAGRWSALGGGVNNIVRDVAVRPNGDAIVGGRFHIVDGTYSSRVVRFDGRSQTWHSLGQGPFDEVLALEVLPDGDVLVGGHIGWVGGYYGRGIGRYTFGGAMCGCPADWDQSAGVDGDDIGAFFVDWQAGDGDVDGSGATDSDDVAFFFERWQAGC